MALIHALICPLHDPMEWLSGILKETFCLDSQAGPGSLDVFLLTPTLRTLGNMFAVAKPEEVLPSFAAREGAQHMHNLLAAAGAPQNGLQKEALWAVSNLAALHTSDRLVF